MKDFEGHKYPSIALLSDDHELCLDSFCNIDDNLYDSCFPNDMVINVLEVAFTIDINLKRNDIDQSCISSHHHVKYYICLKRKTVFSMQAELQLGIRFLVFFLQCHLFELVMLPLLFICFFIFLIIYYYILNWHS